MPIISLMLSMNDLKKGVVFIWKSEPYIVLETKHTHMGRGGSSVAAKIKNLKNGNVLSETLKASDSFEEADIEKKKIVFTAPIHLRQEVKIRDGEMRSYFEWDIFERFYRFIRGLFPRIREKEVGAEYATLREGYFWIGANGQIENRILPEIDESCEELVKNIAFSISLNETVLEQNSSLMILEMNK